MRAWNCLETLCENSKWCSPSGEEKPAGRAVIFWGFYNFIYYFFIFGGAGSLLPCECLGARASHCNGFSCCGTWALGSGSVVLAHGLSCSEAWGQCRGIGPHLAGRGTSHVFS